MVSAQDRDLYRRDVKSHGRHLSAKEREKLMLPYLPPLPEPRPSTSMVSQRTGVKSGKPRSKKPIRSFLKSELHLFVHLVVHLIFGVYIRLGRTYYAVVDRIYALLYYHHRTPELIQNDVKHLSRLPEHLSVILTLKGEEDGGLETLMDEVAELNAWCASAGIPLLSIYEKSGVLKTNMRSLHTTVSQRLLSYFGSTPQTPAFRLHAPNYPSYPTSPSSPFLPPSSTTTAAARDYPLSTPQRSINVLLLSSTDGRDTLIDLTRTLAEMSQSHKLHPHDITQDLINAELSATTSVSNSSSPSPACSPTHTPVSTPHTPKPAGSSNSEPDLLIIFGPYVKLDGYPPWQIRLTEIFCVGALGGGDGRGRGGTRVEYQGFLRGLWKFAGAEMRFGR